jgi:hypothetical protein
MMWEMVTAAVAIRYGWTDRAAPGGWLLLAWGVAMVGVAQGTWYAREWARRTCGTLSVLMAVYGLFEAWLAARNFGVLGVIEYSTVAVSCAWLVWYSLRRSMGKDFRAVRDAITRARAVPG